MIRRWTKEELQYLKDNVNILSYFEIAQKLNRTVRAVASKSEKEKLITKTVGRINKRKNNIFIEKETYYEIIFNVKDKIYIGKIDKKDLPLISQYYWNLCTSNGNYIRTTVTIEKNKRKTIWLHRLLMDNPKENVVDHINGDSLDNRRCNLRLLSVKENAYNKKPTSNPSGVRGLYINCYKGRYFYRAQIKRKGKILFLKTYSYTEEGLQQAKEDLIQAQNFINRNNKLYDKNIPCKKEIKDYILLQEEKSKNKSVKLYGKSKFNWEIKERDNFTCCGCGETFFENPSKLHVHHILPQKDHPELKMDKNNCISICDKCHESIKNREYEISGLLKEILKYNN